MIDFSKISKQTFIGKVLRSFLLLIPSNMTIRILQGPLKYKKWIKGSGVNGYWLGTYERKQVEVFVKNLKTGDIFFDIGANVGFYSILAAELAGEKGRIFSFEPFPLNFSYLKKHIEINNYKNIFPFQAAVSDDSGVASFGEGVNSAQGCLVESGEVKVETVALDDLIKNKKLPTPNIIKIDVEGAEFLVLKGAYNLIYKNKPLIFLSTHSLGVHRKCCDYLLSLGYNLEPIGISSLDYGGEILAKPLEKPCLR